MKVSDLQFLDPTHFPCPASNQIRLKQTLTDRVDA
jgi:hypothetical protein